MSGATSETRPFQIPALECATANQLEVTPAGGADRISDVAPAVCTHASPAMILSVSAALNTLIVVVRRVPPGCQQENILGQGFVRGRLRIDDETAGCKGHPDGRGCGQVR